jgi:fructuronate reductase
MNRLSELALGSLPKHVQLPTYDRTHRPSIVHLGTGAFHRAHQAVYFDALMRGGEAGWMIQGASLRSSVVASQLNPQDGLFTVLVRQGAAANPLIVGSVQGVLPACDAPASLIEAIASDHTTLVTLTITEKGYRPATASGSLDLDDEDVRHDLANPGAPRTTLGFIVAALDLRRRRNASPLTLLSCDNLPNNGAALRKGVIALAEARSPALADWILSNCAFPASMVDRIVPATTAEDVEAFASKYGVLDQALVKTEPFSQWVVEDCFAGKRPSLETVGVQMTDDVAGWETAKLRLLNGAHSALAYLGYVAGWRVVDQAILAPGFREYIEALWDESEATLPPVSGFKPAAYRAALASRFQNSALQHRTYQIAMDGSQKLPQRLVGSLRARRQLGLQSPAIELAIAGWMRWQTGRDDRGEAFQVEDPLARELRAISESAGSDPLAAARGFLRMKAVFGDDLAADDGLSLRLATFLDRLSQLGSAATVLSFERGET